MVFRDWDLFVQSNNAALRAMWKRSSFEAKKEMLQGIGPELRAKVFTREELLEGLTPEERAEMEELLSRLAP